MKKTVLLILAAIACACTVTPPKQVYIPEEFQSMDWSDTSSRWCFQRSVSTDDVIIFWEKGFGQDLTKAPRYKDNDMTVDVGRMLTQTQSFYTYFRDELKFILPGSAADSHKMMVMLMYDDDGTAYGGDYDGRIGALWLTPLRTRGERLNVISHELGHSFQTQLAIDTGSGMGGGGIYEMTSQWMLWQTNPCWYDDERYHLEAYLAQTHLAFLHPANMYHDAHVLMDWSTLRGKTFIADLWRAARQRRNVIEVYKEFTGISQEAFCLEQFEAARRLLTFDWDHVREACRKYCGLRVGDKTISYALTGPDAGGWMRVEEGKEPQQYGFNSILLPEGCRSVSLKPGEGAPEGSGWLFALTGITAEGKPVYGPVSEVRTQEGTAVLSSDEPLVEVWLTVLAAPAENQRVTEEIADTYLSYPYFISHS